LGRQRPSGPAFDIEPRVSDADARTCRARVMPDGEICDATKQGMFLQRQKMKGGVVHGCEPVAFAVTRSP